MEEQGDVRRETRPECAGERKDGLHAGELAALREEARMANKWAKEVSETETMSRLDMHCAL